MPPHGLLLHIQFPITDLRGFTARDLLRLPGFPDAIVDKEFIRGVGIVRRRRSGGLAGWIAEETYCTAQRSLGIDPAEWGKPAIKSWQPSVAFRRFFSEGSAVAKFEIGLEITRIPDTGVPIQTLLKAIFDLEVRIWRPTRRSLWRRTAAWLSLGGRHPRRDGVFTRRRLIDSGNALASLYAAASTPHGQTPDGRLVTCGAPVVFISVTSEAVSAITQLPSDARQIALAPAGLQLSHWWQNHGSSAHVWLCRGDQALKRDVRHLRVFVLRLNAEHQAFTRTLKAVATDTVQVAPGSPGQELLQTYLNRATSNLLSLAAKTRKFAEGNSDLLGVVAAVTDETISPDAREALRQKLEALNIRKNILRKVGEQAIPPDWTGDKTGHEPPKIIKAFIYIERFTFTFRGIINMNKQLSRILAFVFGALYVGVMLYVNIKVANPTPSQWFTFRVILALAAGGVAAMIPGFLNFSMSSGKKFALQTGGALAVFVLIYFFTPGVTPGP